MVPQRPQAARTAARLEVAVAVLLLSSVLALALSALAGSVSDRGAAVLGALLTCAVAGLGLVGARSLLQGTGRGLLLAAAWTEAGVFALVLVAVGVDSVRGATGAGTAVAVLAVSGVGLALAVGTLRLGQRRDVEGWLTAARAWRGLTPGRRGVDPVAAALVVPVALVALGTAGVLALAPTPDAPRGGYVGTLSPASPPPTAADPDWQADLAPTADRCGDGSMPACDDLYWQSSVDGAYERYASTCGGRLAREVRGGCEALLGTVLD